MYSKGEFVKLSWDSVADFVGNAISMILEGHYSCTAHSDAHDYWAITTKNRIDMDKLEKVCSYIGATEADRNDTIPKDDAEKKKGTKSLGMGVSSKLLSIKLGFSWENAFPTEEALWLVGCKRNESVRVGATIIYLDMLKSKDELFDFMISHGCDHRAIHHFTVDYTDKYKSQLYWEVPYSKGWHLGAYFVLVKEGVLMLPYDDADKTSRAKFHLEDACLVDYETVYKYRNDFSSFAANVDCGLEILCDLLRKREMNDE